MEVTVALENITKLEPAPHCFPWEDYVETHQKDFHIEWVMFGICIATIVVNILLFVIIFSNKDFKDQVRTIYHPLNIDIFNLQRCNMFMLSIGFSDSLNALNILIFARPGFIQGR